MGIQAVLFDLDDTLLWDERSVKEAFQATCEVAAKRYGLAVEDVEQSVRHEARELYQSYETFPFTQMIGINPFEGLWANFIEGEQAEFKKLRQLAPGYRRDAWTNGLKALGIEDAALGAALGEQFPRERRARPIVYEETFRVLDDLKSRYRLLLLTNGSPDLQKEKLAGVPALAGYFEHIVISGQFGQGKPSSAIFHHALDKLDIREDEGIMVGDKLTTDIKGALSVGMTAVWINRHQVARTDEIVPDYEIRSLEQIQNVIASL